MNYKQEPGAFWIQWKDFLEWFSEITVCTIGITDSWSKRTVKGNYNKENSYGPQFDILVKDKPSRLFLTLAKKDLRFAVGADRENRHGMYLMRRNKDGSLALIAGTGDWSRREGSPSLF